MEISDPRNRRMRKRTSTNISAKATTAFGAHHDVAIADLSASGCGVVTSGPALTPGVAYNVKIEGLEPQEARAAWAVGQRAGLTFSQSLHVAVADHFAQLYPRKVRDN